MRLQFEALRQVVKQSGAAKTVRLADKTVREPWRGDLYFLGETQKRGRETPISFEEKTRCPLNK